jgi:RimJ/RimL family protein N-acetyltransferase
MQRTIETPHGPVILRTTTAADAAALRELRLEALRTVAFAFGSSFEEESQFPHEEWERRAARGDGSGTQVTYVIADPSNPTQLGGMTGITHGTRLKDKHSATIWGVYVRPAFRGMRLSDALIESCLAWATERGVKIARLSVTTTNIAARKCYRRCGFVITGIEPAYIYCDGKYYDEHIMSRVLDPTAVRLSDEVTNPLPSRS